jgi:TolA-binding protein
MKRRLVRTLVVIAALAATTPLFAQQLKPFRLNEDEPGPSSRGLRNEPLRPPRTLPADPVEPAATPMPRNLRPTPPPVRRAKAVATPLPITPETPPKSTGKGGAKGGATAKAAATPAPIEPAEPGTLRLSPQGTPRAADQAQIELADGYYSRKQYADAAPEYQRYLDNFPGGADVPAALFRLAESHRRNGATNSAKATYDRLIARFPVSEFAPPASFRLAEIFYQERNFTSALPQFRKASTKLKEPAVVNAARFYEARCLEATGGAGNKLEALDLYRSLAEAKTQNPFMDASRLSLALLLREGNRTADALKQIEQLAKQTENPELKAQAAVRAGLWLIDLKQPAKAEVELRRALAMPEVGPWKEEAQFGLLRLNYDAGKYKAVIDAYAEFGKQLSPESQAEALLLVANAQRKSEHPKEALALYEQIIRDYSGSNFAREAQYEQLATLYSTNSDGLVPAIDAFLETSPDAAIRDKVMLMKAEALLKKNDFAAAAIVYEPVSMSLNLSSTLKSEAIFKLGWCHMQTRNYVGAIDAYSRFIKDFPNSKSMCSARTQRGIAYQSLKKLPEAEKDYLEVIRKFDKCPERELALQQEALIRGDQNDNAGMSDNFQKLLKDYPKSPAAAEAHYWIGRTAYDAKDYKRAVTHLTEARQLDKKYFEGASLPLMLAYHFLEDREGVAREVEAYRAKGKDKVPVEVLRWLADSYSEAKSYEAAEQQLVYVAERPEVSPRDLLRLGQIRLQLGKAAEAVPVLQRYLAGVHEPISRATGLLDLARAQVGTRDFVAARKSVDETLALQPEGRLSGEARIIAGDIEAGQGHSEEAAKLYASVYVVIGLDDDDITPRALEKAVAAFKAAGREADAKKYDNILRSRFPEYFDKKKKDAK